MSNVQITAPPARGELAVWGVALGIFALMTSELLPVGLLTPVRASLHVSEGTAGLMVTVPGLAAALCGPLIAVAAGRLDRRPVLCALLALVALANLVSAMAPAFPVLLAARVLIGVGVGGFWAIAGGLALRLVPPERVPRATGIILGGVSTAAALGVPALTLIGELIGWRAAFTLLGALALVALGTLLRLLPPLPPARPVAFRTLGALLRGNGQVRAGVLITFLLVTGHFAAFTFVRPVLGEVSGLGDGLTGALLLLYGVAGLAGNFLAAGAHGARDLRCTLLAVTLTLTGALVALALLRGVPAGGALVLIVWGLAYGGVGVCLQSWMIRSAERAAEASGALLVAVFNLSIALGALAGSRAVDGISTAAALWLGAALTLLAAAAVRGARRPGSPHPTEQRKKAS